MESEAEKFLQEVRLKAFLTLTEIAAKSWLRHHDGFNSFVDQLWNEIARNIQAELHGQRKPWLIINLDLAIRKIWANRIKDFNKKEIFHKATACVGTDFIRGRSQVFEGGGITAFHPDLLEVGAEFATPVYLDEPPSGYNQSPEEVCLHNELNLIFLESIDRVASNNCSRNGELYKRVLQIIYHHQLVNGSKAQLIDIISESLGISRQRAAQLKHHALSRLRQYLKPYYQLAAAQKANRRARKAARLFVIRSEQSILDESCRKTAHPGKTGQSNRPHLRVISTRTGVDNFSKEEIAKIEKEANLARVRLMQTRACPGTLYCPPNHISQCPCQPLKSPKRPAGGSVKASTSRRQPLAGPPKKVRNSSAKARPSLPKRGPKL
ncbi:hypothetical protein [Desulfovulcanus sp.]